MANRLKDVFSQDPKQFQEILARCQAELMERRKHIRLVKNEDAYGLAPLYKAEPFSGFMGDCEYCDHYADPNRGFIIGGNCRKHRWRGCGYGFTCKDNTSPRNEGWDEFERIKKEGLCWKDIPI